MSMHATPHKEGTARERRRAELANDINRDKLYSLDYQRADVLEDAIRAGYTTRELANAFDVGRDTISRWKRRHGIRTQDVRGDEGDA